MRKILQERWSANAGPLPSKPSAVPYYQAFPYVAGRVHGLDDLCFYAAFRREPNVSGYWRETGKETELDRVLLWAL